MFDKKVNTGICISLPENSYGSIRDKSSLASKGLLTLGGVIDKDYTGEIIVIMTSLIKTIKIKKGQKISQLSLNILVHDVINLLYNDYFDSCKKCYSHYYCSCYYYHKKKLYVFFLRIDIKNFMKKL